MSGSSGAVLSKSKPSVLDPRFTATIDLIGRAGAVNVQIRFCEEEQPMVCMIVAEFRAHHQTGIGLTPVEAVFDLAHKLVEGAVCVHCYRPARFDPNGDMSTGVFCLYRWLPLYNGFRRGCAA